MLKPKFYTGIVFLLFSISLLGQDSTNTGKKHKFAVYLGMGPNYYFNNIVTGKSHINEWNYEITARLMWEPEHRLSLGLESGYNRLYTANSSGQEKVHIVTSAVPIQIVVAMRVYKEWFFSFATGPSFVTNKVHSETYGDFNGSGVSLADVSGSIEYKFNLKKRFTGGFSSRFFYSSHTNDKNIALLFVIGYKL